MMWVWSSRWGSRSSKRLPPCSVAMATCSMRLKCSPQARPHPCRTCRICRCRDRMPSPREVALVVCQLMMTSSGLYSPRSKRPSMRPCRAKTKTGKVLPIISQATTWMMLICSKLSSRACSKSPLMTATGSPLRVSTKGFVKRTSLQVWETLATHATLTLSCKYTTHCPILSTRSLPSRLKSSKKRPKISNKRPLPHPLKTQRDLPSNNNKNKTAKKRAIFSRKSWLIQEWSWFKSCRSFLRQWQWARKSISTQVECSNPYSMTKATRLP